MPRQARVAPGGLVYHVLNRAVARLPLLQKPDDYDAFERVLGEAHQRHPIRILAYCLMPNHWHRVLWPREDGQLAPFVRWQDPMADRIKTKMSCVPNAIKIRRRLGKKARLRPLGCPSTVENRPKTSTVEDRQSLPRASEAVLAT